MHAFTVEQEAVIAHRRGYALVSAVAGSGKTDVLVARTIQMLAEGADPQTMLILMFNKSAQEVFQERLEHGLPEESGIPHVLTFHALGLNILQHWYTEQRSAVPELIEDEHFWVSLLAEVVGDLNAQGAAISTHPDQLRKMLAAFDLLKNLDYPSMAPDWGTLGLADQLQEHVVAAFAPFEARRVSDRFMGLNDLLYDSVRLFRLKPDYARQWAHSFQHIMVDEYQDSNPLQHWLLDTLLTEDPSRSLMVVGDEDQCIYTWRAADPDMMVRGFEQRYAGTQRFLLSRTFRYGHAVALMANHVLAYNTQRPDKTVVSGLASTGTVDVVRGDTSEALWPELSKLTDTDAILVREFRHAEDIELLFHLHGQPYRLEGAPIFPARSTGLVLRMSLGCALEKPYRPTEAQAKAWIRWVDPDASSLFIEYLSKDMQSLGVERGIRNAMANPKLTNRQQNHLVQMLVFNGRLRDALTQPGAVATVFRRMRDAWCRTIEKREERRLLPVAMDVLPLFHGETLDSMVQRLEEWTPATTGPKLTSIHRAKGNGWATVVIPHTEAGRFPLEVSEEERRLFYVGITRAKETLVLRMPHDPVRDAMWNTPARTNLDQYTGPTGRFALESLPEYSQKMANIWMATGQPCTEVLTPCARKYETVLYPQHRKTSAVLDLFKF